MYRACTLKQLNLYNQWDLTKTVYTLYKYLISIFFQGTEFNFILVKHFRWFKKWIYKTNIITEELTKDKDSA